MNTLEYNICFLLLRRGKLTRKELVDILDKPRTTIYDNLHKLEKLGFVVRSKAKNTGRSGAPQVYWEFTKEKVDINE